MNKKNSDTLNDESSVLLNEKTLEKVSGGNSSYPESVDCPVCGRKVWYDISGRGRYDYECSYCGWHSGRTD